MAHNNTTDRAYDKMNIAIDSNIFIADQWLRSQRTRVLLDFLEKSNSRILLSEVVQVEVKAHFRREVSECVNQIERAVRESQRKGVFGVPEFSRDESLSTTFSSWEGNFEKILGRFVLKVPAHPRILPEVLRRAAERVPPCKKNGEGFRDAIIWLSLLDYCGRRRKTNEFVFISSNTKDFASPDETSLRDELKDDVEKYRTTVHYYSSLDAFLKQYAAPISHITLEWIQTHVDIQEAELLIIQHLKRLGSETLVRKLDINDPQYAERFVITSIDRVSLTRINELTDFHLWRFKDNHVEATLSYSVDIQAEVECVREPQLRLFYFFEESGSDSRINNRVLSASGKLILDISAEIKGDKIEFLRVERVSRR